MGSPREEPNGRLLDESDVFSANDSASASASVSATASASACRGAGASININTSASASDRPPVGLLLLFISRGRWICR